MVEEILSKRRQTKPLPIDPKDFRNPFSDAQMEDYLRGVYTRAITTRMLDLKYHAMVAVTLEDALVMGFEGNLSSFIAGSTEYRTYLKLRENIYTFSAAKQYQQVRTMSEFINRRGVRSTFSEFKALAEKVFIEYNEQHLRTEWMTAIGQSQMAREWIRIQETKDLFPVLEYRTQRDAHVRDEHAALDGITLPVDHPFWKKWMPKNGWNCRCFTVSHERKKLTNLDELDLSDLQDRRKFPDEFRMNPGRDGYIFHQSRHPYFSVAKGDRDLKRENFKLPVP